MSSLHLATLIGCLTATSLKVRMAANRRAGFGDDRNNCKTVIAGFKSALSTPGRLHIALAASKITYIQIITHIKKKYPVFTSQAILPFHFCAVSSSPEIGRLL